MKIINKEQVSHVSIFKARQGFKLMGDTFWNYSYYGDEYFNFLWLFPIKTLDKGFYRSGKKDSWVKLNDDFFDETKHYTLIGEVYTNPHIDIFSAGNKIHTEYFHTFTELENHLKENYSNCSIRYNYGNL